VCKCIQLRTEQALAGRDGWMDGEYVEGLTISYVCVWTTHDATADHSDTHLSVHVTLMLLTDKHTHFLSNT
jgi:hypothetical protein